MMIDDFESIESLSKTFQEQVVSNQKRLNEIRRNQFQSMTSTSSKIDLSKIREKRQISQSKEKSQDFQQREKSQIAILVEEMNKRLILKIEIVEDNSLKLGKICGKNNLLFTSNFI